MKLKVYSWILNEVQHPPTIVFNRQKHYLCDWDRFQVTHFTQQIFVTEFKENIMMMDTINSVKEIMYVGQIFESRMGDKTISDGFNTFIFCINNLLVILIIFIEGKIQII